MNAQQMCKGSSDGGEKPLAAYEIIEGLFDVDKIGVFEIEAG